MIVVIELSRPIQPWPFVERANGLVRFGWLYLAILVTRLPADVLINPAIVRWRDDD